MQSGYAMVMMLSLVVVGLAVTDQVPCGGGSGDNSCSFALDETKSSGLLQRNVWKSEPLVSEEQEEHASDAENCPHSKQQPATCWGDSAYKACPIDRQGAYDAVMDKKGDIRQMHAVYLNLITVKAGCTEEKEEKEASEWKLVASQNIDEAYFNSAARSNFLMNPANDNANASLNIGQLDINSVTLKRGGVYHLKLVYEDSTVIEWKQASWLTEYKITGFQCTSPADCKPTSKPRCRGFRGIGKSRDSASVPNRAMVESRFGNGDQGCLWNGVGSSHQDAAGIPGSSNINKQMQLYVNQAVTYTERSLVADGGDGVGGHISPLVSVDACQQSCTQNAACNSFELCQSKPSGCWMKNKVITLSDPETTNRQALDDRLCKTWIKNVQPSPGEMLQPTAAPTQSGTIYNTVWGGRRHSKHYEGERLWLSRPQWAKYERCTQDYCEECHGKQECWHGFRAYDSKIETTSSDSGHFVNYTMVVHPECPTGTEAVLRIQSAPPIGGLCKVYYDEALVKTLAVPDDMQLDGTVWDKQLDGSAGKELRLTWIPQQSDSKVNLTIQIFGVKDTFAQCQDQEVCLKVLGDQAGMRLRETNHLLKQCLDQETSFSDIALSAKCTEWLECLEQSGLRDNMAHTLNACRVQASSASQQHGVVEDTPACINPYIADVFSWECDCLEVATHKCETDYAHVDLDTCLHTMLCQSVKICDSWKVATGCDTGHSLVEGVAGSENAAQALLEHGSKAAAAQQLLLDRSLEDSLGAKSCI